MTCSSTRPRIHSPGCNPRCLPKTAVRPIDHFFGVHTFFPDFSSGQGVAQLKTLADYENNLKRIDGYVATLDAAIERFREGVRSGVTQPVLVVDNVIAQLDAQIAQGVEGSPFYGPTKIFPATIPAVDQARLKAAYAAAIRDKIVPADTRLRDYLKNEYRPHSRTTVGLGQMPGGAALYAYLVRSTTTTDLTPDTIHRLGLSEVARIKAGMEVVKTQVGFKGSLPEFFVHMRTDPRLAPKTAQGFWRRFPERQDAGRSATAAPVQPDATHVARDTAGSRLHRQAAGWRLLQCWHAQWLAAGGVLLQYVRSSEPTDFY